MAPEKTRVAGVNWSLVQEIGIDYADPGDSGGDLRYPVSAERASDGTYWIVDEIGLRKNLTTLTECRTLRVSPDHEVLFDSKQLGIDDGFGCVIDAGRIAILRRTTWELLVMTPTGDVLQQVDLSKISPRMPRVVTRTPQGTLLLAFIDHIFDVDIVELDQSGRLLWYMPRQQTAEIGCPSNVQQLLDGSVLVVDEFCHVAAEFKRGGSIAWQYGARRNPAAAANRLSNPMGIREVPDGRRLIADTRNHRILSIGRSGASEHAELPIAELCSPTLADVCADGHYLICDAGNQRVIELDENLRLVWQYGRHVARRRDFSFPRSVEFTPARGWLVADTARNRVVSISGERADVLADESTAGLFWPRCARGQSDGSLLIADGRNSRVLQTTVAGAVRRELHALRRSGNEIVLEDPHDVATLTNGHVLITDAAGNRVVEADWDGTVHWIAGDRSDNRLKDPHSAQVLADGRVLIADTNAHRLVWVDRGGTIVRELKHFSAGTRLLRLNRPKHAAVSAEGILVVVDSFNNRVLAGRETGELLWELSEIPGSRLSELNQPRWAQLIHPNELVVSDHSNHRIVHLTNDLQ